MLEDPAFTELLRLPNIAVAPEDREGDAKIVRCVYDSEGWWKYVCVGAEREGKLTESTFGKENNRRNIVISLSADGFSPYLHSSRSLTPITAMILNLPEHLRHQFQHLLFIGLIPGPNKPKSMIPYMRMIVEELQQLYDVGIKIRDPTIKVGNNEVNVRVKLLFTCADYPGHGDLNCQQVQGAEWGCIKCHVQVRSQLVKHSCEHT